MGSPAERIPSFEELYKAIEALPPGLTGEILEPGVIRTRGRPGGAHRIGAWALRRSLGDDDVFEGGHGWWLEQEAEIRMLGDRLTVPDLAGWRLAEDEPVPPAFAFDNPITRLPTWCCELLSPSTEKVDRKKKLPLYAEAGVEWVWLVDTEARKLEVHQVRDGAPTLLEVVEGDVRRVIMPFQSTIDTSRWWVTPPNAER